MIKFKVNGFISTKEEINNFVNKIHSIEARHIKLNELQHVDVDTYVSFEEDFGVKLNSPFAYGCQTDESQLFDNKIKLTYHGASPRGFTGYLYNNTPLLIKSTININFNLLCKLLIFFQKLYIFFYNNTIILKRSALLFLVKKPNHYFAIY